MEKIWQISFFVLIYVVGCRTATQDVEEDGTEQLVQDIEASTDKNRDSSDEDTSTDNMHVGAEDTVPKCDGDNVDCFKDCWECGYNYHCTEEIDACKADKKCNDLLHCKREQCCNPDDPTDCVKEEKWELCMAECKTSSNATWQTIELYKEIDICIGCDVCYISCVENTENFAFCPLPGLSCESATNFEECKTMTGCASRVASRINLADQCVEKEETYISCEPGGQCPTMVGYALEPGTGECYQFGSLCFPKGWEFVDLNHPNCDIGSYSPVYCGQ